MPHVTSDLSIDRYLPETTKFKSPLIMLHGLWTGGWCWKTWATHFANLGWDCRAVTFRGRSGQQSAQSLEQLTVEVGIKDFGAVVNALESPPLVLAHGFGTLVALKAAETIAFPALILASPLPPRNLEVERARAVKLLRLKYLPLVYFRRPFRIEDKDLRRYVLSPLPEIRQAEIAGGIVPESPHLIAELLTPRLVVDVQRISSPALVLAGGMDQLIAPQASREFGRWLGADFKSYADQGHWMIEADGEPIVRDIHRWLIQKLPEQILLSQIS
jgi:pimeloyl-ACP methyl ester carboxylesterase